MSRKDEIYLSALAGKKIPILTLDNKWHKLFTQMEINETIKEREERVNLLLRKQGKFNSDMKNIKKIKKKLMDEIMDLMNESDNTSEKKVEENKRLINECNEKLESMQDQLLDLPKEIEKANNELMLATMDVCYEKLQGNTKEIEELTEWLTHIRIELKKKIIKKQEKEAKNHDLYAYMHDIFGPDVIEIFDMKYNPLEKKENKQK